MKRRRGRKAKIGVQLFPFLAVLLCTMGALILLLVFTVQRAQVYAANTVRGTTVDALTPEEAEQLRREVDEQEFRRDALAASRAEMAKELANQRLQLSHLEDHIRRLEARWQQLTAEAEKLAAVGTEAAARPDGVRRELDRLKAEIERAKQELEAARKAAAGRKPKFSILPYEGPNGTTRRPIYIECTEDQIVIQPEGIALRADDFEGPMGQGNPLDAALRAIREYLARNRDTQAHGEPYPLLIVRPDGAVAYAVARAAMKSWDDEFGYELVDREIELSYPKPSVALAEEIHRAVADARQRQQILAAAMPNTYAARSRMASGGKGGGSFVLDSDPSAYAELPGGGPDGSPGGVGGNPGGTNSQAGSLIAGADGPGSPGEPFQNSGRTRRQAAGATRPAGSDANRSQAAGTRGESPGAHGEESGGANAAATSPGASPSAGSPSAGSPSAGSPSAGASATTGGASRSQPGSLAKQRGKNWSTPDSKLGRTGITRPILVLCQPDRLVIVPERGDRQRAQEVPVQGELRDAIDDFVRRIWQHVDGWGLAVAGGYWKPTLSVQVAPGAEQRFLELRTLLEDSGIEVQRKP